jgi:uncharacterized protein YjbI with pentapeptide repeats
MFQPTDLTHSRFEPFDYNRRDKVYVKSINTLNGASLQGAQLQHSDWNGVTALGADFSSPTWHHYDGKMRQIQKYLKPSPFWNKQKDTETNLSHMRLRKCDFTGSNFTKVKMEYLQVPPTYQTLPDVGILTKREARTSSLVPVEYLNELRPVVFPNPAIVLKRANLTESSWKNTYLNRVDANNNISPSFILQNANLSNADFSKGFVIHPVTCRRLYMPQVVEMVMGNPNQTKLKKVLEKLFQDAYHLTDTPPKFILNDVERNKQFVSLLGIKSLEEIQK